MKKIIHYNPKLKKLASELRANSTASEAILWNYLKREQMKGYSFQRQKPIDEYIVDFFCRELFLAIEIDGDSHAGELNQKKDVERQKSLESLGIHFLRFNDLDVKNNVESVLDAIRSWIENFEKRNLKH